MESIAVANLGIAQATVSTLGTVMIIGLGFLQRPSRASLLWSLAFILAMVSTWVTLGGEAIGLEAVRRAGLGFMLGAPALIWSGFRARRGVADRAWIAPVQAVLTAAVLVVPSDPVWYAAVFRVVFFVAAVFAGLTLIEIRRSADRTDRLVLPLMLVSGAFVVLGVFILLAGLIFPLAQSDLSLVRTLNALGMLIYLVCATVTLLFFTSVSPVGVHTATSWPQFTVTAAARLRRARDAGETSWALLTVRIDDPDEIRSAAGESSYARIAEQFEQVVSECFPAEADIGRESRGRLVVVLARPGAVLREHVRAALARVTEMNASQQIAVQLSASVGWAPADVIGYDFDALLAAAQRAAEEASARGGDRWERLDA
ncbi:diguanylate cyclase domain-containing protein [Microbacterium sp. NPDC091313]